MIKLTIAAKTIIATPDKKDRPRVWNKNVKVTGIIIGSDIKAVVCMKIPKIIPVST
jgi:hypothetical protein